LEDEAAPVGTIPLLTKVLENGNLVHPLPTINEIRGRAMIELGKLPAEYKKRTGTETSPVRLSQRLSDLTKSLWQSHNGATKQ